MPTQIKICGLKTDVALEAAVQAGAHYAGLVFYPASPRHVDISAARRLADAGRGRIAIVALMVEPHDSELERVIGEVAPDFLQLHGREPVARVGEIRDRFGVRIIKAHAIASHEDVGASRRFDAVADMMLYDAKPDPDRGGRLPGGNGVAFDWRLISGLGSRGSGPGFILSGGLNPGNVGTAISLTGARAVDVSSGVESARGEKDPALIHAFAAAVQRAGETENQEVGTHV